MTAALLSLLLWQLTAATASAQDEDEYRMEIGAAAALATYQGDLNGSLLSTARPMAALVAKYKMNPRMAWTVQLGTGQVAGSSEGVKTWYPQLAGHPMKFKTGVTDLQVRYEYNFWPFGTGREYLGARPLTPFITLGAGLAFTGKPTLTQAEPLTLPEPESAVAVQMPIGLGVKYKLGDRLNLSAEWVMHFTGTDKMDGLRDPYGIKSSGLFKNTDSYTTLQVALTYDIWARCKTCHNDQE